MSQAQQEMAAPNPSVGADGGQPLCKTYIQSIPQPSEKGKENPGPAPPLSMPFHFEQLPDSLKASGRFCLWRYESRGSRQTKVPYDPVTKARARSNDPSSFSDYPTALRQQGFDGLGVGIFGALCAIDLDHCVTDAGYFTAQAAEIVALLHSYTEFSPSGSGLHILFYAPEFAFDAKTYYVMKHSAGVEVYVAGATSKYVTVTGNRANDFDIGDRSAELSQFLERYMRRDSAAGNAANAADASILRLVSTLPLWKGQYDRYPSHSEADLALLRELAVHTGCNAAQIDRLFRQSGLMREKWDRPQSGSTHGAISIEKAISLCRTPTVEAFPPLIPLTQSAASCPPFPYRARLLHSRLCRGRGAAQPDRHGYGWRHCAGHTGGLLPVEVSRAGHAGLQTWIAFYPSEALRKPEQDSTAGPNLPPSRNLVGAYLPQTQQSGRTSAAKNSSKGA